jgi:hypothetical protein
MSILPVSNQAGNRRPATWPESEAVGISRLGQLTSRRHGAYGGEHFASQLASVRVLLHSSRNCRWHPWEFFTGLALYRLHVSDSSYTRRLGNSPANTAERVVFPSVWMELRLVCALHTERTDQCRIYCNAIVRIDFHRSIVGD